MRQESKKPLASSPARGFGKRLTCKRRALQAGYAGSPRQLLSFSVTIPWHQVLPSQKAIH
jgi:hypothetical protein